MCQTLFSGAKVQKIHAAETFVNKKIQNVYHRDYEYTKNNPTTRRKYAGLPDSYYPKSFILYLAGTYPLFITIS